jgi:hexosaminidase
MLLTLFAMFATGVARPAAEPGHAVMPVPASVSWRIGRLRLDSSFSVRLKGPPGDERLGRAVTRFVRRAEGATGLVLNRGASGLTLVVKRTGERVQSPAEDESYTLEISSGGATLETTTTVGALRGLETVLQLIEADSAGWYLPSARIEDRPRFPWRGLLIDVGRHWEPPEVIKRQLDGMAAVKLNVLHWHLSEDQGFRVESRRFPRLQQLGSDGLYYTQEQIRDIVSYARDRGIRVVPEFDMPGHSTAWFVGYPAYASGPGPFAIERRFGVFAPTFDPTRNQTYQFLEGFIAEMAALFPDSYWHIGGDEVEGSQWRTNRRIRAFMRAHRLENNGALQAYFNRRLSAILTRHGKRMVGWDEILHPALPRTTVVQSWRGQASLLEGARRGYRGILSAGWYLDHMRTAEFHYLVDPLPEGNALSAAEASRVLGGEACMWGEHVTPESIDSRIWPRLGAIAERLWSPRDVRDVPDMYRRLGVLRGRLELLGLGHEAHTARMARRLADGQDAAPLTALLELMEPVRFGERASLQPLTQQIPLVFAVDAARPDPPSQWNSRSLVTAALTAGGAGAVAWRSLDSTFTAWAALAPAIDSLAEREPLVKDAVPAAHALARVAAIGSEAMPTRWQTAPPPEWIKAKLAELDALAKPQGLLRVTVIPAVRQLVESRGAR